ncbi:orexin receptor type 2 [Elysia marginata]|uniref:Orexin receptor type 2 n=1 Tax=Elysia marginata TaxID=1093978 RepID=A0AAV4I2M3_9GAST|nr:orexin receptor type 2 [Elysia marginata]
MSGVGGSFESGPIISAEKGAPFVSNKSQSLTSLNGEQAILNLPITSFLLLVALLGTAGNTCVVYVYRTRFRKNSGSYFIMALAVLDLLNSAICLPWEIYTLSNPYKNDLPVLCKVARFVVTVTYISAALILVCVAFSRYFKIAHPLRCYSSGRAQSITFLMVTLALAVSWPQIPLSGTRTVATRVVGVNGHDCAISDKFSESVYASLSQVSLYVVLSVSFLLMLLFYLRLIITVWARTRRRGLGRQVANRDYTPRSPASVTSERSFGSSQNLSHATSTQRRRSRFTILAQVGRTTRMLVLVTCVFLLGYLPFLTINVLALFDSKKYGFYAGRSTVVSGNSDGNNVAIEGGTHIDPKLRPEDLGRQTWAANLGLSAMSSSIEIPSSETASMFSSSNVHTKSQQYGLPSPANLSYSQRLTFELCSRSYFLSSAANPLIYSVLNFRFRQESMVALRHVILRLPHWLRRRFKVYHTHHYGDYDCVSGGSVDGDDDDDDDDDDDHHYHHHDGDGDGDDDDGGDGDGDDDDDNDDDGGGHIVVVVVVVVVVVTALGFV